MVATPNDAKRILRVMSPTQDALFPVLTVGEHDVADARPRGDVESLIAKVFKARVEIHKEGVECATHARVVQRFPFEFDMISGV